jgi:hypothetical protein
MSLEEIFYISQTAAAVAVVTSLIYLALQVRQAERIQRAIMQQGRADRASQGALALADPELARVFRHGMSGDTELTRDEFTQWSLICRALLLSGEDSFLQHKAGLLDKPAFDSYVAGARFYLASPGLRAVWKISGAQFGRDFREFVSSIVEKTPAVRGVDAYAEWQKLLQPHRDPAELKPHGA